MIVTTLRKALRLYFVNYWRALLLHGVLNLSRAKRARGLRFPIRWLANLQIICQFDLLALFDKYLASIVSISSGILITFHHFNGRFFFGFQARYPLNILFLFCNSFGLLGPYLGLSSLLAYPVTLKHLTFIMLYGAIGALLILIYLLPAVSF